MSGPLGEDRLRSQNEGCASHLRPYPRQVIGANIAPLGGPDGRGLAPESCYAVVTGPLRDRHEE